VDEKIFLSGVPLHNQQGFINIWSLRIMKGSEAREEKENENKNIVLRS
jgi:hypothetical protein